MKVVYCKKCFIPLGNKKDNQYIFTRNVYITNEKFYCSQWCMENDKNEDTNI